jgi:hypothetical protein
VAALLAVTAGDRHREHPRIQSSGMRTRWTSLRKVKEGETTNDLFTCSAS